MFLNIIKKHINLISIFAFEKKIHHKYRLNKHIIFRYFT
ncbi:hypothetical protein AW67_8750 [Salmonella enterica subsp. enterica serovar Montevideo str. USDA-ARS-USMARC-1903]|uniref:Uncharacterized protein n=1 Tax=Salmonella enterica subsp. enterica serovar Montevideo str. S5-403 TaxID=913242 RepID=G5PY69_SALMO|nr:hypothetical protein AW67_8750 [Salmonella enterica subsp. enterica serovar Montevideo str. USDA-ARS-USMARC-1903]EHC70240.1 hypothetical protein LTSEJOH_0353 [Salmonella enterica subsp. enterica serovar Johannesburg str. S5-703]EHC83307.1 hypothetical protein LTSEMON_0329 [Salmonella enterica subsp. enterica serovar Montevideo str. S5-403]